ncbi:hypothetical protein [Vibrio europaeus]|uniref:hypothetical protein n=1 Tax=Vibrio europaeus TaxID=300876 RepID=UPI00233F6396|nr:hypothetical protein [Vibrio europaeus]MDC5756175.1 hypothetical protein [Vibrio europaeus]MDC5817760.1 hypothetical protein [Vibrio europaeus]
MLNRRRVRLRPSQGQVKQVLLKTANVLLVDERYKIPIDTQRYLNSHVVNEVGKH